MADECRMCIVIANEDKQLTINLKSSAGSVYGYLC